ncbi:MAG: nitronate monooxygenase [Eubacteriales bacterium]|nr:nitronate monooxygenase [Eubacteriales bacterium]
MYTLKNKTFAIPIIQGGMGVGVSLSSLAGHVAKCGAIGTISAANTGFVEEDFDGNTVEANLRSLKREIEKAKEIAEGNGLIAVNIMCATSNYDKTCKQAVEAGADIIVSGAGLALSLPEYTKGSETLCAPIVSSGRAARLLLKHYKKHYDMEPDFFVIEGSQAGGHLGFSAEDLEEGKTKSNLEILEEVKKVVGDIPVFVGGGVFDAGDRKEMMDHGAYGVQIGTRFIATEECDAHPRFKQAIVDAKKEDIILIKSPVGMPARAINSPLMKRLAAGESFFAKRCNNCLTACPRGNKVPYCISRALIEAVTGNWEEGLFFTGSNADRIHKIVPVKELIEEIMS